MPKKSQLELKISSPFSEEEQSEIDSISSAEERREEQYNFLHYLNKFYSGKRLKKYNHGEDIARKYRNSKKKCIRYIKLVKA